MISPAKLTLRHVLAVFGCALALRLLFCLVVIPAADLDLGMQSREFYTSTDGYLHLATNLVEHGRFAFTPQAPPTTYRGPGYPAVLGLASMVIGHIGVTAILVNCLASALTCVIIYGIAAQLFGGGQALLLTVPAVFFPLSIYYCASSFADAFFTFTAVLYLFLVLWMTARPTVTRSVLSGLAFAMAALTKGVLLPFPVILLGYAAWRDRALVRSAAISAALGFCLVGGWTARNYLVSGQVIPVSVGPGFTMLAGNYVIEIGPDSEMALPYGEAKALGRVNSKLNTSYTRSSLKTGDQWDIPRDTDRIFHREAWSMFWEDPLLLPRKLFVNACRFWYFSSTVLKCVANLLINYTTLILAVAGLLRLRRTHRSASEVLALYIVFFVLVYAVVNVSTSRYCLPAILVLTPLAASAAVGWLAPRWSVLRDWTGQTTDGVGSAEEACQ